MRRKTGDGEPFLFGMTVSSGEGRLIPATNNAEQMAFVGVLHGQISARIGVFPVEGSAGDVFFVPSGTLFFCNAKDGFASVRMMTFHSSLLTGNMDALEQDLLYMLTVQARNSLFRFGAEHPLHARLSSCMQTAADEYLEKEPCYQLPIRANIYLMMTALLRYYSAEKKDGERAVYHNVLRMKGVLDRIERDAGGKITVPELAGMLLLTPDHFTRIFRECVGSTPIEYINRVRLDRALILLASEDTPVSDVAKLAGFSGVQHFYKLFHAVIGSSPVAFRKSLQ